MQPTPVPVSRRRFLAGSAAAAMGLAAGFEPREDDALENKSLIAITLDLEMARHYPKRGMMEWDYQKGNLDEPTKNYAVEACRVVKERGGLIHTFCVGRVLEQANVDWLKEIAKQGHPVGNHTYDHVYVKAKKPEQVQFRFRRAPWLIRGKSARQVVRENIEMTTIAMKQRAGIQPQGFRTPGGFHTGLSDSPEVQKMLLDLGFTWASAKYPPHLRGKQKEEPTPDVYASIVKAQEQAQPFVYESGLVEIPMSPISDVTGFRSTFWKLEYFLKATRMSVEWAIRTGGVFDFLAHPSCLVVEDPKFEIVKLICDLVNEAGDKAAIVDLGTIAKRTRAQQSRKKR